MEFKITLPEQEIKPEIIEKRNRAMFTEDLEKNGVLAKVLVFTYLNKPCTVTEITKIISKYYKLDIDRAKIFRAYQKLVEKGLVFTTTPGDIIHTAIGERKEVEKEILTKYYSFLENIPESFKKNFTNINYYWLSNGEGTSYLEWCCKILNFKCEAKR